MGGFLSRTAMSRSVPKMKIDSSREAAYAAYACKRRPPESVLAKYRNSAHSMPKSPLWHILNYPAPPPPEPSRLPLSQQLRCPLPPVITWDHYTVDVVLPREINRDDRDAVIDYYIKLIARVVGSEEEAKKRIYSVSTKHIFRVSALLPEEEYRNKLKVMPCVGVVLPDEYRDAKSKGFRGEPFVNGEALPYDPKYHDWYFEDLGDLFKEIRTMPRHRYKAFQARKAAKQAQI